MAVAGVVIYHAFPNLLSGGFIGVDIFFVLSGFLITGNLLALLRRGRLRDALRSFLGRRARRILPPLAPLLVAVGLLVWALGRGSVGTLSDGYVRQVLGALTFTSNWVAIAGAQSYFLATAPVILKNLWSLAVEEQFYLIWPFVLVVLLRAQPRRRVLFVLVAALASAAAMAVLAGPGDPSRAYYGTDTHVFGLLLGAAVALVLTNSGAATALRQPRIRPALVIRLFGSAGGKDGLTSRPGVKPVARPSARTAARWRSGLAQDPARRPAAL